MPMGAGAAISEGKKMRALTAAKAMANSNSIELILAIIQV